MVLVPIRKLSNERNDETLARNTNASATVATYTVHEQDVNFGFNVLHV